MVQNYLGENFCILRQISALNWKSFKNRSSILVSDCHLNIWRSHPGVYTCLHTLCSSNSYVHLPDNIFFFFPSPLCFPPLQNNIAEVKELHSELMWKDFIDHISKLLHSVEVEVSYFAAGIIAHLISRGEQAWTLSRSQRTSLLEQLVLKWRCSLSCSSIFVCLYLTLTVLCSVFCSILPFWTGRLQSVRWWLTGNYCLDLEFGKYSRIELSLKLVLKQSELLARCGFVQQKNAYQLKIHSMLVFLFWPKKGRDSCER